MKFLVFKAFVPYHLLYQSVTLYFCFCIPNRTWTMNLASCFPLTLTSSHYIILQIYQQHKQPQTNLVNSLRPNLRNHSNTTLLKLDYSLPGQIPVPSVNKFPRPPTPIFSYPSSRITFHTNKLKHAVSKITTSN